MSSPKLHDHHDEILDIVDENDVVLFQVSKDESYGKNLRKRIAHVIVTDPQTGTVGIQVRGKNVSWQAGYYCPTACGHVQAGETWEQGALRETTEELGLENPVLTFVDKFAYTDEFKNHFVLGIYTTPAAPESVKPHPDDVDDIVWLMPEEVRAMIDKGDKIHNHFVAVMTAFLKTL